MLHVFIGEILTNMTQVSDVAPGPLVSFVLSNIHWIFGTLLYHTKMQIKFKFGFDPLIFQV
jgi:hypothetical protein